MNGFSLNLIPGTSPKKNDYMFWNWLKSHYSNKTFKLKFTCIYACASDTARVSHHS
jgi:hypothetical protein